MTIFKIGSLVQEYYSKRLNFYEKNLLNKLMEGVAGLGEPSDQEIKDYLSDGQIAFIKKLGKKFRITTTKKFF